MSEIAKIILSFCVAVLSFPLIVKFSNFLGECVYDAVKTIVANYKEQWKDCMKIIERWFKHD